MCKNMYMFSKYILYVCVYLYVHNKYTQCTHILSKQKPLFWMWLITINHLTELMLTYQIKNYYDSILLFNDIEQGFTPSIDSPSFYQ